MKQTKRPTKLVSQLTQAACLTLAGVSVGAVFGQRSLAQNEVPLNPCPSIYYEEPFNQRFMSPTGCPANAARQAKLGAMPNATNIVTPSDDLPLSGEVVSQPPLPEELSHPIAMVQAMNKEIMVSLVNETNAPINYEVLGETEPRILAGGQTVMLRGLSLPSTITTFREDKGLVSIRAMSEETGMLKVMLGAQPVLSGDQGVLQIQEDGRVFLN